MQPRKGREISSCTFSMVILHDGKNEMSVGVVIFVCEVQRGQTITEKLIACIIFDRQHVGGCPFAQSWHCSTLQGNLEQSIALQYKDTSSVHVFSQIKSLIRERDVNFISKFKSERKIYRGTFPIMGRVAILGKST